MGRLHQSITQMRASSEAFQSIHIFSLFLQDCEISPFLAARYHSLIVENSTLPEVFKVTAWTEDGTIMGLKHKELPNLEAVQFHPESIITDGGKTIIQNFIDSLEE